MRVSDLQRCMNRRIEHLIWGELHWTVIKLQCKHIKSHYSYLHRQLYDDQRLFLLFQNFVRTLQFPANHANSFMGKVSKCS